MDVRECYNTSAAAAALDRYMSCDDTNALNNVFKDDPTHRRFVVHKFDKPKKWAIVSRDCPEGREEPFMFHLKCVLTSKAFPPFDGPDIPHSAAKLKYMRVAGSFVGLGVQGFEVAVTNINILHGILERAFPERQLQRWNPSESFGWIGIDMSNRIFTPDYDADKSDYMGVPRRWDPTGKLQAADKGKFWFLAENFVDFRLATGEHDANGIMKSESAEATLFRVGDIVDAEFTLHAVQVGKQLYKMMLGLRSITLVDDSFTEHALICEKMAPIVSTSRKLTLKRKLAAEEQEEMNVVS